MTKPWMPVEYIPNENKDTFGKSALRIEQNRTGVFQRQGPYTTQIRSSGGFFVESRNAAAFRTVIPMSGIRAMSAEGNFQYTHGLGSSLDAPKIINPRMSLGAVQSVELSSFPSNSVGESPTYNDGRLYLLSYRNEYIERSEYTQGFGGLSGPGDTNSRQIRLTEIDPESGAVINWCKNATSQFSQGIFISSLLPAPEGGIWGYAYTGISIYPYMSYFSADCQLQSQIQIGGGGGSYVYDWASKEYWLAYGRTFGRSSYDRLGTNFDVVEKGTIPEDDRDKCNFGAGIIRGGVGKRFGNIGNFWEPPLPAGHLRVSTLNLITATGSSTSFPDPRGGRTGYPWIDPLSHQIWCWYPATQYQPWLLIDTDDRKIERWSDTGEVVDSWHVPKELIDPDNQFITPPTFTQIPWYSDVFPIGIKGGRVIFSPATQVGPGGPPQPGTAASVGVTRSSYLWLSGGVDDHVKINPRAPFRSVNLATGGNFVFC